MKKYLLFLLFILLVMVGCANEETSGNENKPNDEEDLDPVTITIQQRLSEEALEELQELVTEKYPHITVEQMDISGHERNHYEEAVAAQRIPDILAIVSGVHDENLFNVELDYDLTELIDKFDYDLSRFDEMTIEGIRAASREGLMGLPSVRGSGLANFGALMYNKEIFDLLGVEYPTDGMTWDEILKLAKELTVEHNGVQYYGLTANNMDNIVGNVTLEEPLLDAETHESMLDSPNWRRGLELLETIYRTPGYLASDAEDSITSHQWSFPSGSSAMAFGFIPNNAIEMEEDLGIDWDIVAGPVFPDGGLAPVSGSWIYTISAASEHKDDAFRVLETLMLDEFMILEAEREGEPSRMPLVEQEVIDKVELHPVMEGKNLDALYFHEAGPPVKRSKYESYISREFFREAIDKHLTTDDDLNTFIRETNEEIEQLIEDRISNE